MSQRKAVVIIPSRLESSRLPNKALADIHGQPMIVHVYKRCMLAKSVQEVYVATDSVKIQKVILGCGGKVIMTSAHHETGSDRLAEAANNLDADIIVNVQGDEALVDPEYIDKAVNTLLSDPNINIGLLVCEFKKRNSPSDIKVVTNENNEIMYLSRSDIPSNSRTNDAPMLKAYHIVPFRRDFLMKYSQWEKGCLEKLEFNEYLRILEKGFSIKAIPVESDALSVDTPEDLEYVRRKILKDKYFNLTQ